MLNNSQICINWKSFENWDVKKNLFKTTKHSFSFCCCNVLDQSPNLMMLSHTTELLKAVEHCFGAGHGHMFNTTCWSWDSTRFCNSMFCRILLRKISVFIEVPIIATFCWKLPNFSSMDLFSCLMPANFIICIIYIWQWNISYMK